MSTDIPSAWDPMAGIAKALRPGGNGKAPNKPPRSLSHLKKRIAASETPDEALHELWGFALTRCGAKTRKQRKGRPCLARALANGKCRNHGGMSTGPRTPEGRLRALRNLTQYRDHPELLREARRRTVDCPHPTG